MQIRLIDADLQEIEAQSRSFKGLGASSKVIQRLMPRKHFETRSNFVRGSYYFIAFAKNQLTFCDAFQIDVSLLPRPIPKRGRKSVFTNNGA